MFSIVKFRHFNDGLELVNTNRQMIMRKKLSKFKKKVNKCQGEKNEKFYQQAKRECNLPSVRRLSRHENRLTFHPFFVIIHHK